MRADSSETAGDAQVPDHDHLLDVRAIDGPPFEEIMAAVDSLEPAETLLLCNSFEPVPLYQVLADRGFAHETTEVDGVYYVTIDHA